MAFKTIITNTEYLKLSKRKCAHCGERKEKSTMFITPLQAFCDRDHAAKYAFKNKSKGADKIHKEKKKAFRQSDVKIRKAAAISVCHKYIRARDVNNGCFTCGRSLIGVKFDAGHFLKATNSYTKFMEKNIHGQCVNCNQYNGGRELEYREAIIQKYGIRTLRALERCKTRNVRRTAEDYLKIEEHYKAKLKELQSDDNSL